MIVQLRRERRARLLREAGFRRSGIPPLDPRLRRGTSLKAAASPPQQPRCPGGCPASVGHPVLRRRRPTRVRTVDEAMQEGRWTTRPCDWGRVEALADALGVSETTATVLVRRGLDEPAAARAFLEAEPPGHDPFALGDMTAAVDRIRAAVAAGERICVHGDYDVDGISATALAVLTLRELGAQRRVAPAEPLRGGLRPRRRDDRAPRGGRGRPRAHGRLRHHGGRGGRRAPASSGST